MTLQGSRRRALLARLALLAAVSQIPAPPSQAQAFNIPPLFQNAADFEVAEGEPLGFYVWARDPEGEVVSYDVQGLAPSGGVTQTLLGDLDGDGVVTQGDVGIIDDHLASKRRPLFDALFDLNNDRSIDDADANLLRSLVATQNQALFASLAGPSPGTFELSLTATDPQGASSSIVLSVVIADLDVRKTYSTHDDVLVVVNDASPISVEIGDYFVAARKIRASHVVHVAAPTRETISFDEFTNTIRVPIEQFLTSSGAVDEINYIVTTKGVPLRISGTTLTRASVDSELTLILGPYAHQIGGSFVDNPVAGSEFPFSRRTHGVFLVTRLTGYTYADVIRLIDNAEAALSAQRRGPGRQGTRGLFVFDVDPSLDGTAFQIGNGWMRNAATVTEAAGFQTLLDETSTFVTGQADVLGYTSWGSNDANDTNHAIPGFSWFPGALAETFVSMSARSFALPPVYGQSLIADLIAEGVTGAKGYVYEPFLGAVARPHVLFDRYSHGFNLADSYYMASSFLSWMDVVVGDPKTRIDMDVDADF